MSTYIINPQAIETNYGGILNLTFPPFMNDNDAKIIDIYQKLNAIWNGESKFFTVNVFDTPNAPSTYGGKYLGDCECVYMGTTGDESFKITNNYIDSDGYIYVYLNDTNYCSNINYKKTKY